MKTVVIFDNFGPYHWARLRSAARVCDLLPIQIAGRSAEYAWKNEAADGCKCTTLFQQGTSRGIQRRDLVLKMNQALDDFRPEVVFIPGWSSKAAFAALRWCVCNHVPAVVMSESTAWDERRVWWKEWVKQKVVGLSSAALVGGRPHKEYMMQLGMPPERIFLGYDAVDNGYFADKTSEIASRKPEVRSKYELPENYFLASARFIEKKNLQRLIRAYARYRDLAGQSQAWDLVVLGDGPLKTKLTSQISDLHLRQHVHLPGFKQYDELPVYYGLAKIFIHASTTEQWGLVVNEAMACGLPILVSNRCGCAADLVREGQNGFAFNPTDENELAQLMIKMSDVSLDLKAMGQKSLQIIADWSPEQFAENVAAAGKCAVACRQATRGYLARGITDLLIRLPETAFRAKLEGFERAGGITTGQSAAAVVAPNFFIIGAPKCGTTSLSEYLKTHPNIYFSRVKEPHFFDLDVSQRLKLNLQTYLSLFANADPRLHKAVGEGSTGYLFSKVAVSEILKFNPNAKFIVMLRNPLELVPSWHSEMYFEGVESVREFAMAWKLEGERRRGKNIPRSCWEPKKLLYSEWGKLGDQMERLFSVADRDRVKVILFDDFVADTKRVYEEALAFLEVQSDGRTDFPPINESRSLKRPEIQRSLAFLANHIRLFRVVSGLKLTLGLGLFQKLLLLNSKAGSRKALPPVLQEEMADFYRDDVRKLSKLLGRDLSYWVSKSPDLRESLPLRR